MVDQEITMDNDRIYSGDDSADDEDAAFPRRRAVRFKEEGDYYDDDYNDNDNNDEEAPGKGDAGTKVDTANNKDQKPRIDLRTGANTMRCQSIRLVETGGPRKRHTSNRVLQNLMYSAANLFRDVETGQRRQEGENEMPSVQAGESPDDVGHDGRSTAASAFGLSQQGTSIRQYRIVSKSKSSAYQNKAPNYYNKWMCGLDRIVAIWTDRSHDFILSGLTQYFYWTFRSSFTLVIAEFAVLWLVVITFFAVCIFWVGHYQPYCFIRGDTQDMSDTQDTSESDVLPFIGSWHLSWTTLSTVGYGILSPGLRSTAGNYSQCTAINVLMAYESFLGVLFGSVTGAVLFAKISRSQAFATVQFSDPMVVMYGIGCQTDQSLMGEDSSSCVLRQQSSSTDNSHRIDPELPDSELPCPVLEFRIMNTMWQQPGGEIMDASVNLVVSRLEKLDPREKGVTHKKKGKGKKTKSTAGKGAPSSKTKPVASSDRSAKNEVSVMGAAGTARLATGNIVQQINHLIVNSVTSAESMILKSWSSDAEPKPYNSRINTVDAADRPGGPPLSQEEQEMVIEEKVKEHVRSLLPVATQVSPAAVAFANQVTVDEGNESLAPRQTFHSLPVEADFHPFFKRVWNIRHVVDQNSPLLSAKTRRWIQDNNGFWPADLNSADAVRNVINFHEIIVSISGTANVSGASVYLQHVYKYVDMVVGYTFVRMLAKNREEGRIDVDGRLLNDIVPQRGGGAEPIRNKDTPQYAGYTSLTPFEPNVLVPGHDDGHHEEELDVVDVGEKDDAPSYVQDA